MIDLTPLNAILANLGPWGPIVGIGLTLLVQWVARRRSPNPGPTPPPAPTPDAPVAPAPNKPEDPRFPALARLRELLKSLPLKDIIPLILPLILERKAAASQVVAYGAGPQPASDPVEDEMVRILAESLKAN